MLFCVKHLRYTMGELKYHVHTKCNAAVCVEIDINALLEIPARDLQSCVLNFVLAPNVPEHVSVDLNFRFKNICTGRNTDTYALTSTSVQVSDLLAKKLITGQLGQTLCT